MALVTALLVMVFPVLVIVAALKDLTSYTIPNWISLALLAAYAPAALAFGLPLQTIGLSVAIGFAALVLGIVLFALRWIGGGDAKLFAAAALWVGLSGIATFALTTCLAGGGLAMFLLAIRTQPLQALVPANPRWLFRLGSPDEAVPYGVAICVGALSAFAESPMGPALGAAFKAPL